MMAAAVTTFGPLSWQQLGRMRRDAERGAWPIRNGGTLFRLPESMTPDDLRARLADLVRREEVLRITDLSYDRERTTYANIDELPISGAQIDSIDELKALAGQVLRRPLADRDAPLWEAVVIEHPDEAGRPARSVCTIFDLLICDFMSVYLLQEELTGAGDPTGRQHGRWPEWVRRQRDEFPTDFRRATEASEFWRSYLDDTPPDRSTILPFWSPGPLTGTVQVLRRSLHPSMATLAAAGGRLSSSPFMLFLAGLASAIGIVADLNDVTFRVLTTGRPPEYLDTLGIFADTVPIRVRADSLRDIDDALAATTASWLETLDFQHTPWDYILAVCNQTDRPSIAQEEPQVYLNFRPWAFEPWVVPGGMTRPASYRYKGSLGTFQLSLSIGDDDECYVDCHFDAERFVTAEVSAFLDVLAQRLHQLAAGD